MNAHAWCHNYNRYDVRFTSPLSTSRQKLKSTPSFFGFPNGSGNGESWPCTMSRCEVRDEFAFRQLDVEILAHAIGAYAWKLVNNKHVSLNMHDQDRNNRQYRNYWHIIFHSWRLSMLWLVLFHFVITISFEIYIKQSFYTYPVVSCKQSWNGSSKRNIINHQWSIIHTHSRYSHGGHYIAEYEYSFR